MLSSSSVIADIVAPVVQKEQPGKAPDPAMTHSATLRLLQYRRITALRKSSTLQCDLEQSKPLMLMRRNKWSRMIPSNMLLC